MGSIFSNKRTQQQATNSNQSGSTENNLWDNPQLQQFLSGYNQQYAGAGNFNVPINDYQTGAAQAQSGVMGNLNPAFATAGQIGSDGITQASIDKYMTPYIKGVVDPTMAAQDMQNKAALSNLGGSQAARGALGNNTGSGAAYMAGVQPQQQAQIAGLYQQGYGQAVQTAGQDAALRLQGAGTTGTLTNVATGANTALGGMGQNIWQSNFQNAMTPYSLYNQGVQGFTGFGNLAGTNYSGQSSGTSNGTSSETPSIGSIIAGLAGTAMAAYSDERVKDDIKPIGQTFDGQPIYKFRYKGSPMTQIGLMAQDVERRDPGAVGSDHGIKTVEYDRATKGAERASGGPVNEPQSESLIDKVLKASHALRSFRDGGAAPGFAAGGMPGYDPRWSDTKTIATPAPASFDFKGAGGDLSKMGSNLGKMGPDDNSGFDAIAKQQQALTQGMQGIMPRYSGGVVPGYDDGGEVYGPAMDGNPEYGPAMDGNREYGPAFSGGDQSYGPSYIPSPKPPTDAYFPPQSNLPNRNPMTAYQPSPQPSASVMGAESSIPTTSSAPAQPKSLGSQFYEMIGSPFSTGVWKGDQITPMQRAGAALTQIGSGPFAGVGQHILGQQKMRLDEMAAERAAAALMGKYQGQPTLASSQFDRQMAMDKVKTDHMMTPELTRQLESAGYVRGTPEFQKAYLDILTKGKGDRVETEFDKSIAKASAGDLEKRAEAVRSSQGQLQRIEQFERLTNDPNVRTGKFAETELEAKKMLQAMGFDVKGVPQGEALRALGNQFALSMRSTAGGEGMPGAMSDADRTFLMSTVPGLGNTKDGNAMLIKAMRDTEQYKIRVNTEAQRYIQAKRSNVGLGEYMTAWMAQNPMDRVVPGHAEMRATAQREVGAAPPQRSTVSGAEAVPHGARDKLMVAANNKATRDKAIADFNATFNGGKPGLAESLLTGTPRGSAQNPHDGMWSAKDGEYYTHQGKVYQRKSSMNPFASDPVAAPAP